MYYNHFIITGCLTILLFVISYKNKNPQKLYNLLTILLIFNILTFNIYLILTNGYNYKTHLPIHLCYLTEVGILLSIIFKIKYFYPWLTLNSVGGGLAGFLNSHLTDNSVFIEYIYLYISHFNLFLFAIFLYKTKFIITKSDLLKSIMFNALVFTLVVFFNAIFDTNYWFTRTKPDGINIATIFPEWPAGFVIILLLGFICYYCTFKIFAKNKKLL